MSNAENSPRVSFEPSPLETAIRDRSWDWLMELRRRLKVELAIVDARPAVLLPQTTNEQPARLLGVLEQGDGSLLDAVGAASRTRVPQTLEVSGLQIVSVALGADRMSGGVLLVGRTVPSRQDSAVSRAQLELVASWLSTAIEAHIQSPPAFPSSGINRVAPLARLLGQASEHESDRELVRLFGEAVAVWHDIEVCGYVETSSGSFARDVTLPGTRRGERPAAIPAVGLSETTELSQLPQGHLDRFGLPVDRDVYVRRFKGVQGRSWLLVFIGAIDRYHLQRLGAYIGLLELALSLSVSVVTTDVALAISQQLSDVEVATDHRVRQALEQLRTTVGAASASVTIEGPGGATLLEASAPNGIGENTDRGLVRLVLVKESEPHYTTTVSLSRHESLRFTPRDHAAASAAAVLFGLWAKMEVSPATGKRERRAAGRGFHEVLERSAAEAIERGRPVAVVVLMIRDAVSLPGSTQRWVTGIRGQMRASDVAGMLAEGEIGLLMHDAGADQAKSIAERLRAIVGNAGRESILIGAAGRNPGEGTAHGIVQDARADALAGTRRSRTPASPHGVNR
jgi:hypothetical protein